MSNEPQEFDIATHGIIQFPLDNSIEAIVGIDLATQTIVYFNGVACSLWDYLTEEVVGKPLGILMPDSYRNRHSRHVAVYRNNPEHKVMRSDSGRLMGKRRDGTHFRLSAQLFYSASVDLANRPQYAFAVVSQVASKDLTKQREKDRALSIVAFVIVGLALSLAIIAVIVPEFFLHALGTLGPVIGGAFVRLWNVVAIAAGLEPVETGRRQATQATLPDEQSIVK